jgi:hypothetical protein
MASKRTVSNQASKIDRTAEELEALRAIVRESLHIFDNDGHPFPSREDILSEALKCASDDLELLENCDEQMSFVRAQSRIRLALSLADYVKHFGFPKSAEEIELGERIDAEVARQAPAGGAS